MNKEQPAFEVFFNFEEEHNLFSIQTHDNLPFWDIIRAHVWFRIILPGYSIAPSRKSPKGPFFALRKLSYVFSIIYSFFKYLFLSKATVFYFGVSRVRNKGGEYYDPYYESIKDVFGDTLVFYESCTGLENYSSDKRLFDISFYWKKIIKIAGYKRKDHHLEDVAEKINSHFNRFVISPAEIRNLMDDFRIELNFYHFLLKKKKIKKLIVTQNGIQKALYTAARKLSIPIYEFQHGDIVESTVVYNYGFEKKNLVNKIIYPDFLLMFSDLWCRNIYNPAQFIEVGTDFFNSKIIEGINSNSITIITSRELNSLLEELAFQIATLNPSVKIYYKLHPAQYQEISQQKQFFRELQNVEVVGAEKSMSEMLKVSNEFIAIYSTALYEALQAGKIVYIYKRQNYLFFKSCFNLPGVYLFETATEFNDKRKNAKKEFNNANAPSFFKPFNRAAFESCLKLPIKSVSCE